MRIEILCLLHFCRPGFRTLHISPWSSKDLQVLRICRSKRLDMGLKRVSWVRRYQGQCRALRPLGHQGCRLRNHKKDQPLCSGYTHTPDCSSSGRAAGAPWGVRGRTLSHPRLPALSAGCRGRCGASGVGRSPTPDCPPSGRAAGAVVGRPSRMLSHPRLPTLWAGCRGRCGASGVGRSPCPDCSPSGRAAGAGVERPGSDALPTPTARPLGGLPGPMWGVRGRALSHPRLLALWAGCRGRCGASGVGRSPTPDCSPSGRAAGPVWGVWGRALSHPRLPALWAGCRGRCGASGVGRSPSPDCPPSGRAAQAGVGRQGSGALPPPTARPSGGLPGCCACACPAWPGRAGRLPGRVLVRLTFPLAFLASLFACSAPSGLGLPCLWLLFGSFSFRAPSICRLTVVRCFEWIERSTRVSWR